MLWISPVALRMIGFTMFVEVKIVRSEFGDRFRSVDKKYQLHSKPRFRSQMWTLLRTKTLDSSDILD